MHSVTHSANILATAFAAGRFDPEELVQRGSQVVASRGRWLRPLAVRLAEAFAGKIHPRKSTIVAFLVADAGFCRAYHNDRVQIANLLGPIPEMIPTATAANWQGCLALPTPHDVSRWLNLAPGELDWFADRRRMAHAQSNPKLQHYRYRLLQKRPGEYRLIEAPKPRLKAIQRRILSDILNHVPPHEAAHGFRRGRSITSFAAPHVGKQVVLKMDLQDFFPSTRAAQIQSIFRFLGYPDTVADLLTGLCTTSAPQDIWPTAAPRPAQPTQRQMRRYAEPHLPQGAPTSPVLANLCAYRMDLRFSGLASTVNASYTRYADDMAFSGNQDFARVCQRFSTQAAAIAIDEGYTVHFRKTRIMKQGACQRVAGMVINRRLNISRKDYDRLKAVLTNCARHGPDSQNHDAHNDFRSHLEGRVSFVEQINPERGRRLRALLERIDWSK
ncbi:RNA-directed DNA polymerase [Blastopirellula marina]|uniref:RNA-directed DNA polymerase n=1 Tax=Blastopirellula marina TaxID=124 RepID=A0A2S8FSZ2_9BACT|nr:MULTISPECIES: reverse transcriptase family protein [Pirellulaceae]PQO35299.1 RNA-directed DNA polymerase [Blastopirellula marina]RCS53168.1 RNA-directed DNA polymerase [Bremerella cremea]